MIIDAPIMNKTLENIKLIFSTIFFLAGIIVFLSALGWNDQHIGHQIGGNMGNTIANLGNSRHWGQIILRLLLAIIYPLIALLTLDFQPFLLVYLGGIGGCMILLILAFVLAGSSLEE